MPLLEKDIYEFGAFLLDPSERLLSCNGTAVSLTPKAFEILLCLVRNHGHMVSKDELLREVWPDTFVEEVNLAVNVSAIRKALGENPQECRFIATVPGRGYRFVAEVRNIPDQNRETNWSRAAEPPGTNAGRENPEISPSPRDGYAAIGQQPTTAAGKRRFFMLAIAVVLVFVIAAISPSYLWRREKQTNTFTVW